MSNRIKQKVETPDIIPYEKTIPYFPEIRIGNIVVRADETTGVLQTTNISTITSGSGQPAEIDYTAILSTLLGTEINLEGGIRMPLRSLLAQTISTLSAARSDIADLSGVRVPAVASSVSALQTSLASYALSSDLQAVSGAVTTAVGDIAAINAQIPSFALASAVAALGADVAGLISTTGVLALDEANTAALAAAASLSASTIAADLVLNSLSDVAALGSISTLSAVVSDLSGNVRPRVAALEALPAYDPTPVIASISAAQATADGAASAAAAAQVTADGAVSAAAAAQVTADGAAAAVLTKEDKGARASLQVGLYDASSLGGDSAAAYAYIWEFLLAPIVDAGKLLCFKTTDGERNAVRDVCYMPSGPAEGTLRRFANVGGNRLDVYADGAVVAEILPGEVVGLIFTSGAWMLATGF